MKTWLHSVQNQSANDTLQLCVLNPDDALSYDLVLAPGESINYCDIYPDASVEIPEATASTFADRHLRLTLGRRIVSLYASNDVVYQVDGESFGATPRPLTGFSAPGALALIVDNDSQLVGQRVRFTQGSQLTSVSWAISRYAIYGLRDGSLSGKSWLTKDWEPWTFEAQPDVGLSGPLAAVCTFAPKFAVYALGNDGALWEKTWSLTHWDEWVSHQPPAGVTLRGISAVNWLTNHYGVYATASDGHLYQKYVNGVLGWTQWTDLGQPTTAQLSGPITAVSWISGRYAIYALGSDGQVWEKWYGLGWSRWGSIGSPASELVSLTSSSPMTTLYSVAGVGKDGSLYAREYKSGQQKNWVSYGHPPQTQLAGPVTALGQASGNVMYYAEGADGAIYEYYNQQWSPLDGR